MITPLQALASTLPSVLAAPVGTAASLAEAVAALPWLVQVPVGLATVAGLLLWVAGRRFIRPVTIMVGLSAGALLGFVLMPVVLPSVGIAPWLGLLGGAATGLTVALLLYQVATAITFGSALGAGSGVLAAAILGTSLTLPAAVEVEGADAAAQDPMVEPSPLGGGEQPVYIPPPVRRRPAYDPRIEPLPEPDRGPEGSDVHNPGIIRAKPVAKPAPKPVARPAALPRQQQAGGSAGGSGSAAGTQGKGAAKPAARPSADRPAAGGGSAVAAKPGAGKSGSAVAAGSGSARVAALAGGVSAQAREFWGAARRSASAWWQSVPTEHRPWISGAAVGGVAIGTVLGLLLPAWSAGAVTALAGSAIWLSSGLWLATAWKAPLVQSAHTLSVGGWIAVWIVAAAVGIACQWYGLMPGAGSAGGGAGGRGGKKGRRAAAAEEE